LQLLEEIEQLRRLERQLVPERQYILFLCREALSVAATEGKCLYGTRKAAIPFYIALLIKALRRL